jgi:L-asparaginase
MARKKHPLLLIHGGAGSLPPKGKAARALHEALAHVLDDAYSLLAHGASAVEAAARAAQLLEDDPLFNAGLGSKLQADGKARLSASLMDGDALLFSGVVNVEGVRNPVLLARGLAQDPFRVLVGEGAKLRAEELGLELRSAVTRERLRQHRAGLRGKTGTIGAVALDQAGRLAAATSTGGRGMERPGRVSDSPTVAGNYANGACAVSATGIGEEIVDFALAARLAVRVEDGMPLREAFRKTFREARRRHYQFGAIAVAADGAFAAETTTAFLSWGLRRGPRTRLCPT